MSTNSPKPDADIRNDRPLMQTNYPPSGCPECGAKEVSANTPRTVYDCGSSDYDQRPGTFRKGQKCKSYQHLHIMDEVLGKLREAKALMEDERNAGGNSRELSMAITKIDEAVHWRQDDLQKKNPPVNEADG